MYQRANSIISGLSLIILIGMPQAFGGEPHLLLGTWAIDVSKMTRPSPPKSVTIGLSEAKGGVFRMTVDIVSPDGTTSHGQGTFKSDGSPSQATGSADLDNASITMPNRRVLVLGAAFRGHPANTRVFSLSDDGRHMIETIVSHGSDGTPHTEVNTWNRLK
jgi:hypothetical protein